MQFTGQHVPWKVTNGAVENLVLQVLQLHKIGVCHKLQVEQTWVIIDLMSVLWRVNLMLVLITNFWKTSRHK